MTTLEEQTSRGVCNSAEDSTLFQRRLLRHSTCPTTRMKRAVRITLSLSIISLALVQLFTAATTSFATTTTNATTTQRGRETSNNKNRHSNLRQGRRHSTIITGGLTFDYIMNDNSSTSVFGNLQQDNGHNHGRRCVCGCTSEEQARNLTRVDCSVVAPLNTNNAPPPLVCFLQNAVLYGSKSRSSLSNNNSAILQDTTLHFGTEPSRIPLLIAVCDLVDGYSNLFESSSTDLYWENHHNWGVRFDHVSEWRIANLPASKSCGSFQQDCRVPSQWKWVGTTTKTNSARPYNGWMPQEVDSKSSLPWEDVLSTSAPQLQGASVAYIDSGDCWLHNPDRASQQGGEPLNPWHCKAPLLNWFVLTGLFERYPQELLNMTSFDTSNVRFFPLAGYDEYYMNGQPTGGGDLPGMHELQLLAGAGIETGFHDDDHNFRTAFSPPPPTTAKAKQNPNVHVEFQGLLPRSVLNAPPSQSLMWIDTPGKPDKKPDEVIVDYRMKMEEMVASDLRKHFDRHPLEELANSHARSIQWIEPPNLGSKQGVLDDIEKWSSSDWRPSVLKKFAILFRRAPIGQTMDPNSCRRCLLNDDDVARQLADSLDMYVLVVHPTTTIPATLQTYLWLSANLVVGMHGGCWAGSVVMTAGQAAVEIVPERIDSRSMVELGGGSYEAAACPDCVKRKSRSGQVVVTDIMEKANHSLASAKTRYELYITDDAIL